MQIKIEQLSEEELKKRKVPSWPIWEKEISTFDWHYDDMEECLFLEGDVTVTTKDGKSVNIKPGDFVTFPKGLSCSWNIKKPVKKYYRLF
ncbi:MAG: cupin domain-containing protein [Candidatus Omnitrophota bacterium]